MATTVVEGVSILLGGLFFLAAGLFLSLYPAASLLKWDRRTGYYLYKQKLAETGDENRAVEAARTFYRLFGTVFAAIGALVAVAGILVIII